MCMEDVRIGRKTYTLNSVFIDGAANGWKLVAIQRPDRYSLTVRITCNDLITYTTWTSGTPPTVPFLGISKDAFVQYDLTRHGDIVTQPFWVVCNTASLIVLVTEVIFEER